MVLFKSFEDISIIPKGQIPDLVNFSRREARSQTGSTQVIVEI